MSNQVQLDNLDAAVKATEQFIAHRLDSGRKARTDVTIEHEGRVYRAYCWLVGKTDVDAGTPCVAWVEELEVSDLIAQLKKAFASKNAEDLKTVARVLEGWMAFRRDHHFQQLTKAHFTTRKAGPEVLLHQYLDLAPKRKMATPEQKNAKAVAALAAALGISVEAAQARFAALRSSNA